MGWIKDHGSNKPSQLYTGSHLSFGRRCFCGRILLLMALVDEKLFGPGTPTKQSYERKQPALLAR